MNIAIITAGGLGSRMGLDFPKQFLAIAGRPILVRTLQTFAKSASIHGIIVVVPASHLGDTVELIKKYKLTKILQIVMGGKLRQDSVRKGLAMVQGPVSLVVVHDGARPLVTGETIAACVAGAEKHGAAMAAIPVSDTIKDVGADGLVRGTVDRRTLWQAQTPQVVKVELLREAFAEAEKQDFVGTDEASLLELIGVKMAVVSGSETNIKITRPDDIAIAQALLAAEGDGEQESLTMKIGHGFDVHSLVLDRDLIIGGVKIPHSHGLLGHSDADVLCHALADAILGALALGDIGCHFPDNDPAYKGIASILLLEQVVALGLEKGFVLSNADITMVAQSPKFAPHWPAIKENLAKACQVSPEQINLKGTTTEGLGFTGRQEGISCHAVVLLEAVCGTA